MASPESQPPGGNAEWLVELFTANIEAAFNVGYRLVWNRADAEDVVQNAFIKAAHARDQLLDHTNARGWLLSITYREALQLLRSRRDLPTDPFTLPERAGRHAGPEETVLQQELAAMIQGAIDRLPETLRIAFVLRDVEALPMDEVAHVLDLGASAAKMRVARAREALRLDLTGRI